MVNIVLIGTGDIARKRHIPALRNAAHAHLYGFYNRNPEKAAPLAAQYGAKLFQSWEEVLADPAAEAVLICTPPASHADLAVEALRAGKHVLLEKPMTLDLVQANRIKEAAEEAPGLFTMLHVQRFYRPHATAKALLAQGQIGRLLSIRSILGNGDTQLLSGEPLPVWQDALSNVGIHRIDLMRWLTGSEVTGVFCRRSRLTADAPGYTADADDHAQAILEFADGTAGMLIASRTCYHGEDRSTWLIGTEGTIITYHDGHDVVLIRRDGTRVVYDFPDSHPQKVLEPSGIHEEFALCIEQNLPSPVTVQDGIESIRILDTLERSNKEKRWITLLE